MQRKYRDGSSRRKRAEDMRIQKILDEMRLSQPQTIEVEDRTDIHDDPGDEPASCNLNEQQTDHAVLQDDQDEGESPHPED